MTDVEVAIIYANIVDAGDIVSENRGLPERIWNYLLDLTSLKFENAGFLSVAPQHKLGRWLLLHLEDLRVVEQHINGAFVRVHGCQAELLALALFLLLTVWGVIGPLTWLSFVAIFRKLHFVDAEALSYDCLLVVTFMMLNIGIVNIDLAIPSEVVIALG